MLKYPFLIILVLLLLTKQIKPAQISYKQEMGRNYGELSSKIIADSGIPKDTLSDDFYVCGLSYLQTSWMTVLWNCDCGRRWYRWRLSWRCNWCDNWFYTEVSSIRVKLCHKNSWQTQQIKEFKTQKQGNRNWRQITCPKGQYATGISIRLGTETDNSVDTGMVGGQLRCENTKFTEKTFVQDDYGHPLTEMSKNPKNTFITGFQFKYVKNDKIVGLVAYFGEDLNPTSASIEYGKVELDGNITLVTVETLEKSNTAQMSISYTVEFTKNYSVTQTWTNDIEAENSIKMPENIKLQAPILNGTKNSENIYYTTKSDPIQFKIPQTVTFIPAKSVPTSIPYCTTYTATSVVEEQKGHAPYTLTLTYVSPTTSQIIVKKITGVWKGYFYKPIQTSTFPIEIEGCKND